MICDRFELGCEIGAGSFGIVYSAADLQRGGRVAIKLERVDSQYPQLMHEVESYWELAGGAGIPKVHWSGVVAGFNCMAMDLLGRSLADMLDRCGGKLALGAVFLLADQLIEALEHVHKHGLVHRDIKPANLVLGRGKSRSRIHLIDFGLAARYTEPAEPPKMYQHIQLQRGLCFAGTARYASIGALQGKSQSRRDDLQSLGYVLLYLNNGSLPWMGELPERATKALGGRLLLLSMRSCTYAFAKFCSSCHAFVSLYYFSYFVCLLR